MALACQKNSYLTQLSSKVVSCESKQCQLVLNGKKSKINGFELILEDTILFPEGGGQPDDRGTIEDIPVLRVTRRGDKAVHFVEKPVDEGKEVSLTVDWQRRFDHMQQHTGQHLISALAESRFGYATTSWNLGDGNKSFIELNTPTMTDEEITELEKLCNDKIREGLTVTPKLFYDKDDPEWKKASCRGLPDDHVGPIRVLNIEGVDSNLCCGTHVSSLAHLQAIKLLGVDKGKKSKVNLLFVVGQRLLDYFGKCYAVEKGLTNVLSGPLEKQVDLADKAVKNQKASQKLALTLLRDMAVMEAKMFKLNPEKQPLFSHHRKEGDGEYMNIIATEIGDAAPCFLTTGDEKGSGMFLLCGSQDLLDKAGKLVMDILEAKGACSGGRYRGKANKLANKPKAEQVLLDFIAES
ncbi:hypothetical protein SNE40_010580 [Patella caerulea]|uniref:Alanyl-transfer RNA synthetases family profile domain-containing protein n=1 Tax=Patella caerulea TaxID=87958 RepID=A0AAN8Q0F2_PATCE